MRLCLLLAGLNIAVAYQKLDYDDDGITCQEAIDCRDCCEQLCWLMADSEPCHVFLVPQCTKQCEHRARWAPLSKVLVVTPKPLPKHQPPWWW